MSLRRAGFIIAAGAALFVAFLARPNRVVRATGQELTFVEEVLPVTREQVLAAIGRAFHSKYRGARSSWVEGCSVRPFEPGDERSMAPGSDPALLRFIALPAEQKRDDVWLECDGEWESEYLSPRGEPLPFTTKFIIHVAPVSTDATRLEVMEYFPYVIAGKKLGFQRDVPLPWMILDTQRVAPTTSDRVHVLKQIRQALRLG